MAKLSDDRYPRVRATKNLYVQYCPEKLRATGRRVDRDSDYAYRCIMDMIYETGDRLKDDDRILSEVTRSTMAKWRKCRAVLLEWGLLRIEDGRITSDDAQERLDKLEVQISQKSVAGTASASARSKDRKPLENNETGPTAVQRPFNGCSPAVGTKTEGRREERDDDARVREAVGSRMTDPFGLSPEPPKEQAGDTVAQDVRRFVPRPCPPKKDPNAWAIIQAMDEAVIAAYGWEVGEYTRHFKPRADWDNAAALLKTGEDLKLTVEETIEGVREHLFQKCRERAAESGRGAKVPSALSWFTESAGGVLVRQARSKARAEKGFVPEGFDPKRAGNSGNGRPSFGNGGDTPTATTLRQPWQETQKRLMAAKQIDAARQLSAAAAESNAAANQLAAEMEGRLAAKRHPAAQAA